MYSRFIKYIEQEGLAAPHERILLAVSGGIDSMVMAQLFVRSGLACGVGHCNFGLRGSESDGDEQFVRQWADERQLPFYTIHFDTKVYAAERGLSTQMAARELRYNWFGQLLTEQGFDKIAIAHHAGDQAETLLLNLIRGTGLKGLCSMTPAKGNVIRPLLFASREQIRQYATMNGISYREDASNASDDYARNYIRHHTIPGLESLNPSVIATLQQSAAYLAQAQQLLGQEVRRMAAQCCRLSGDKLEIDIRPLQDSAAPGYYLHEWLQPYGFNSTQIDNITTTLSGQPGKLFFSPGYQLTREREQLLITPLCTQPLLYDILIDAGTGSVEWPLKLQISTREYHAESALPRDRHTAYLDASKLSFPLTLRRWQDGDSFVPLGMKGKKKLSDFFIDNKVPHHLKEAQYVILSGNDIVWVAGHRIDDRYKVTPATKNIYRITWKENPTG